MGTRSGSPGRIVDDRAFTVVVIVTLLSIADTPRRPAMHMVTVIVGSTEKSLASCSTASNSVGIGPGAEKPSAQIGGMRWRFSALRRCGPSRGGYGKLWKGPPVALQKLGKRLIELNSSRVRRLDRPREVVARIGAVTRRRRRRGGPSRRRDGRGIRRSHGCRN
jgi:hypothetical protein